MSTRRYDSTNTSEREWSSRVYQAAKDFVPRFLQDNGGRATFEQIRHGFKGRHSNLCDDSLGDPSNPGSPYWGHLVATAMQILKKSGAIQKGDVRGSWTLGGPGEKVTSSPPPVVGTSDQPPVGISTAAALPEVGKPSASEGKQAIGELLLTRLLALTPSQFERLLGEFLKARGFSEVRVTGRAGDGGIDGECDLPFIKVKVAFQAKRYNPGTEIRIDHIRNFRGGLNARDYDRGLFITTSAFSAGAKEEADLPGVPMALIDDTELVGQMIELGLGVKTIPVVETQMDEGFFETLES